MDILTVVQVHLIIGKNVKPLTWSVQQFSSPFLFFFFPHHLLFSVYPKPYCFLSLLSFILLSPALLLPSTPKPHIFSVSM